MTDVKVVDGNNRQCDLLAVNLVTQEQFHVESSVTHDLSWLRSDADLREIFDKKCLGVPPMREGENTDHAKGKTYFENILDTYRREGLDPLRVQRVFVTWGLSRKTEPILQDFLESYAAEHGIHVQVMLFRDRILPELTDHVSTSHYEDEVLRTLSLLKQRDLQVK